MARRLESVGEGLRQDWRTPKAGEKIILSKLCHYQLWQASQSMLVYNPKLLNKSMDANRRQLTPLDAAGKFGAVVHDPTWVSAAVRHLSC